MDLIERYVYEVGRQLPRKQRADIQVELKSTLVDTLEDRVEGEPSQEDEIKLLKEFGPPRKVAASYWPQGQYLIGPNLFPLFRMVVGDRHIGVCHRSIGTARRCRGFRAGGFHFSIGAGHFFGDDRQCVYWRSALS